MDRVAWTWSAAALVTLAVTAQGCSVHVNVLEPAPSSPCDVAVAPADSSRPDTVVGDGTPGGCTEAALDAALARGGIIRFRCGAAPVTLALSAEKLILRDTVLDGGNTVTLDGGTAHRIFVLGSPGGTGPALTLQYLTLRRGRAEVTSASAAGGSRAGGGAVLQLGGVLVVTDSVLAENEATASGPEEAGGAICALGGRLVVARSTFDGNRAGSGGAIAAIGSELVIVGSQLTNNRAVGQGSGTEGIGGAVLAHQAGQSVAMCRVTMAGNQATYFGTALHLQGTGVEPMTIAEAAFLDNLAPEATSSAGSGPAVFLGIVKASLRNVTVARNKGRLDPGVWVNGGTQPAESATVQLTNVTIAENQVYRHADPTTDGVGGALWIEGVVRGELVNCTLAGNLGGFGAGIVHPEQLVVRNTIISNQGTNPGAPQNCAGVDGSLLPARGEPDLQWPVEALGNVACTPAAVFADPLLGPLQDNGGYAPTMLPAAGSPAAGAGLDCPATDQRGRTRAARCTLGAVEIDGNAGDGR